MRIFIDTAELNEIRQACAWGIIDGVTTNPSLIKKAVDKRDGIITMEEYIKEILRTVPGPVSLEVISVKAEEMVEQGLLLYKEFSPYGEVAVKIPVNPSMGVDGLDFEGLRAIRQLREESVPVNCTLVMTPEQALLAAKAGATYVSPFAGRIDDYIRTNLGMKQGAEFKKEDYFDYELLQRASEVKITEAMSSERLISELYRNKEIKTHLASAQDNGVMSGVDLVAKILKIYHNYGYKTQVIAASIRNARQAREMAEIGVDISTLPLEVIKEMVKHPKTVEGMKNFTADIVPQYEKIFKAK